MDQSDRETFEAGMRFIDSFDYANKADQLYEELHDEVHRWCGHHQLLFRAGAVKAIGLRTVR